MKKLLCIFIFTILISCNKNNQASITQNIHIGDVEKNNQNINTESSENDEGNIKFSVGNVSLSVPNNYATVYVIEGKYVDLNNLNTTILRYIKAFKISIFRKDGDYEEYGEYGVSILPALTSYLNGTTQKGPDIYVSSMRKNKFKGINVCETLTLSRYVIDDTQFEHQIIFIDNEYCYIMQIYFGGLDFDGEIKRELSDYFNEYDWIIDKEAEIYIQFENFQKMPEYIEKLYAESMRVFNTLKFNKREINVNK